MPVLPQVNYFHFIAEEIRAGLASLGMRSLDELTGRSDLLKQRDHPLSKTSGLDLSFISRFVGPCMKYGERSGAEVDFVLLRYLVIQQPCKLALERSSDFEDSCSISL